MVAEAVWLLNVKRPSSTHTPRIINASSVFRASLCVKLNLMRDDLSFWYHSHEDCFSP